MEGLKNYELCLLDAHLPSIYYPLSFISDTLSIPLMIITHVASNLMLLAYNHSTYKKVLH